MFESDYSVYLQNVSVFQQSQQKIAEKIYNRRLQSHVFLSLRNAMSLCQLERQILQSSRRKALQGCFFSWKLQARFRAISCLIQRRRNSCILKFCFGFWQRAAFHVLANENIGAVLSQLQQMRVLRRYFASWLLQSQRCAHLEQVLNRRCYYFTLYNSCT